MSIFKTYFDYLNFTDEDIEEFLHGEYTDVDSTNVYELKEYTLEVGDDDLPF